MTQAAVNTNHDKSDSVAVHARLNLQERLQHLIEAAGSLHRVLCETNTQSLMILMIQQNPL
jgi:hypothetical protein